MNAVPTEFSPEYVAAHSPEEEQLYRAFLKSGEPYRSLNRHNFHPGARLGHSYDPAEDTDNGSNTRLDLDDQDLFYNTRAATEYWSDYQLPTPQQDIRALRRDLHQWGYCLIADGLSPAQLERMQRRLREQAQAERLAGIASWMGTLPRPGEALPNTQFLHSLINKGEQFIQCVEHDPVGVQAGPVIEQLLRETVGSRFLMSSFIAIISNHLNPPQGLHQDQAIAPHQDPTAPFTCNTMFVMDDMSAQNGSTLVVPGSHRLLSAVGSGQPLEQPLPPAINVTAPAGTVILFEGRLLHGTGVNRTHTSRTILVMNAIKPFMRQQEMHLLSARSAVLANASPKLLYRLGAQPTGLGGIEGAWNGDYLVGQRLAMEAGTYQRVGQLSPDSTEEVLGAPWGYRFSDVGARQQTDQPETLPAIRAQYADSQPAFAPVGSNDT